ncbi:MAG: zinc-ribbon domain-containing protein [Candidatus Bathyarchaeia archaeon]
MPTCPHCGATVPEGAVYCGNCGASNMQARYEKAIKRTEWLSYAAAGLGVAILVVLIAFSFL